MMAEAEYKSGVQNHKLHPLSRLQGRVVGVFCEDSVESWPRYNALYCTVFLEMCSDTPVCVCVCGGGGWGVGGGGGGVGGGGGGGGVQVQNCIGDNGFLLSKEVL